MPLEQPAPENWGEIGEIHFSTVPEPKEEKPKQEDPDSPELVWTKKVEENFKADHPEESEQLPN